MWGCRPIKIKQKSNFRSKYYNFTADKTGKVYDGISEPKLFKSVIIATENNNSWTMRLTRCLLIQTLKGFDKYAKFHPSPLSLEEMFLFGKFIKYCFQWVNATSWSEMYNYSISTNVQHGLQMLSMGSYYKCEPRQKLHLKEDQACTYLWL